MFTVMSGHYMPLTWLTHGLDYVLWGMKPAGYHAVNVVLHAGAAAAAYFVAVRVLRAAVGPTPRAALSLAAAAAALLFAVHPLRVESVAWITERRDVLCGVFFLLAVLCYLRAVETGARRPSAGTGRRASSPRSRSFRRRWAGRCPGCSLCSTSIPSRVSAPAAGCAPASGSRKSPS